MFYFKKEQKWQKDLIRKIAKEENLDIRVVRTIAYYPMLFLREKIEDSKNERAVRIRRLGAFLLKKRYQGKKDVTKS
jgi:hypothetical protein